MLNAPVTLTQRQLADFLLNVAPARPVFIWGPPSIGKSALCKPLPPKLACPVFRCLAANSRQKI